MIKRQNKRFHLGQTAASAFFAHFYHIKITPSHPLVITREHQDNPHKTVLVESTFSREQFNKLLFYNLPQGLTFLQKWSGFSPYHLGDSYRFVRVGLKRSPLELSEDLQGAFLYLFGVRGSVAPKTWVILLPFTFKGVCKLFRRASPLLLYFLSNFYSFHCSALSMQIVLFNELYNLGYYEKGGHRGRGTGSEHGSWKKEKNGTTQGMVIEFRFCSHFSFSRFPFLVISNI